MSILQRVFRKGVMLAGVSLSMVPLAPLYANETPTTVENNTLSPERSLFDCVQPRSQNVEPPPISTSADLAVTAQQLNPAPVCSNQQMPQPRAQYSLKGYPDLKQPSLQLSAGPQSSNLHYFYVRALQAKPAVGAEGFLSQHMPYLAPSDYHSLAEIAVQSSDQKQTVEVGWTVDRTINKDNNPHLFVYHWINGQGTCYNGCGFVQRSLTRYPGMTVAVTGSPQEYAIRYYNGNWWVEYQNEWIGYFPGSLWNNQFTQTGLTQWFGEVAATGTTSCTHMGNGIFGTSPGSALMTDLSLLTSPTVYQSAAPSPYLTMKSYYDYGNFTGKSFSYGGSGGQCQ